MKLFPYLVQNIHDNADYERCTHKKKSVCMFMHKENDKFQGNMCSGLRQIQDI